MRLSRALVVMIAACHHAPSPRDRVLERLPATAMLVAAADGVALADPVFRRAIDVARPHVPASLGCVVDAALSADAVALAAERAGIIVVIASRAAVKCPALSKLGPDLWTATIGAAAPVAPELSVVAEPRWARALPYLKRAPIGFAVELGAWHVVAAATPAPLDAWVTIDGASDATVVEKQLARWPSAAKLHVDHDRDQIVARGTALSTDDLAALATELLRTLDAPAESVAIRVACPVGDLVVRCTDGTHLVVRSVSAALAAMTRAAVEPVVVDGDVIGLRLDGDPPLALRRGDVVLGLDARRIANAAELASLVASPRNHAVLAVRRDDVDLVFVLGEPLQ